jgi:5-methylthioadenosine/S-adenosylhomocysteine deaminase
MSDTQHILIDNALVIPNAPGQPAAFRGWVLVSGNRIADTGQGPAPQVDGATVVDASECALLPGLVNTHAHSHSSLTRGSAEGLPLGEWLKVIEQEQAHLTEEQAYVGALATYAEALLSGTTLISDMCLQPRAAIRAAEEIGIRVVVAPYVAATKPFTPSLSDTEALLADLPRENGRVRGWCGLHDIESCGDEQLIAGRELADRRGVGLHMHCSETRASVSATKQRTGRRPVHHLAQLGLLGPRTLLAHCVWVDQDEMHTLASNGTSIAHCPHANLKLGSGIAPVPELTEAGVNVTLATDGAKANNRLDMFDVMKFASLLHKGHSLDPSQLPPELILDMTTQAGARALGAEAGVIVPSMLADLILVRLDSLHLQPAVPETIVTNLVHAARGSDVELVMVDGRIVVKDGRLQTVDQYQVLTRLRDVGAALLARAYDE